MKKIILLFYFLLSVNYTKSQNLVPNPSFEDNLQCPFDGGQIGFATSWYSPTSGSTDYFNSCGASGYVGVPYNIRGYQNARTGNAYISFVTYGSISGISVREYAQIPLMDTLTAGTIYCVSFYVSSTGIEPSPSYLPVIVDQIGLLFSNNAIITTNTFPLPYTPQIVSPAGVFLNDTAQWMEISGTYTALGGERFITIGNFKDDANTDTLRLIDNGLDPQGYYYVDDVTVMDCADTGTTINEYNNNYDFNLYPNPNNGNMTLKYSININDIAQLQLKDITGKQIAYYNLPANTNSVQINNEQMENGMYIYHIIVNNKAVKSGKLLIIR